MFNLTHKHTDRIPPVLQQTNASMFASSYRVKPNPAQGKGQLHVLRHCVQQQV